LTDRAELPSMRLNAFWKAAWWKKLLGVFMLKWGKSRTGVLVLHREHGQSF